VLRHIFAHSSRAADAFFTWTRTYPEDRRRARHAFVCSRSQLSCGFPPPMRRQPERVLGEAWSCAPPV